MAWKRIQEMDRYVRLCLKRSNGSIALKLQQLLYILFFFLQEDIEASLDNLQDIDMMDISVLDEAEIDNGNAVDCGEDYSADNILDSLSDSKENANAEVKELPDQPTEYAVGNLESSPQFSEIKEESREIPVVMVCISYVCGIRFFFFSN